MGILVSHCAVFFYIQPIVYIQYTNTVDLFGILTHMGK